MANLINSNESVNSVNVLDVLGSNFVDSLLVSPSASLNADDVKTSEFRAKVLHAYIAVPFPSFLDWLPTDEAKEYKNALFAEAKNRGLHVDWDKKSPIIYKGLKNKHDASEKKRIVNFSLSHMVSRIDSLYKSEFVSLVGCSASDVVDDGALTNYALVDGCMSAIVVNKDRLSDPSFCLSSLLSYKVKLQHDGADRLEVSRKHGRYYSKIKDSARDGIKLEITIDSFLADCKRIFEEMTTEHEQNIEDSNKLHVNIDSAVSAWWALAREAVTYKQSSDQTKSACKRKLQKMRDDLKQRRSALNTAYSLTKTA